MRKRPAYFSSFAAVLLTALSVIPFLYVFAKSLLSAQNGFTLSYYYQVFLAQEQYLLRFWKSLGLCLCITAGQSYPPWRATALPNAAFPGRTSCSSC